MKNLIRAAAVAFVALPFLAGAQAVSQNSSQASDLAAQIQSLLGQIAALQAQIGSSGAGGSSSMGSGGNVSGVQSGGACYEYSRTLQLGASGADVSALQQFLASDPAVYPEGNVSGYFGSLTQAAVQRWQAKNGIVSSGSPSTTGYGLVGPRTAAAMASQCSGGNGGGTGAAVTGPVGGFIQVTPVVGNAPLPVSVTATVNTTNSCTGATYTLDWGDGTVPQQIMVPAGQCSQLSQTLTHTYTFGGTFQVRLAAGTHQTYATVTVSGPSASAVSTPSTQTVVTDYGLPNESFNASTASGVAPLTVTFSGVVTSNDAGFQSGASSDALDFGDGTMAQVALPASHGGWLNYSVAHTYKNPGGYRVILYQGAIGSPKTVGNITITVSPPSTSNGTGFGIIALTPGYNSDPLTVSLQVTVPSCAMYQVNWGDSSAVSTATASCTGSNVTANLQHTYAAGGAYTVKLNDGSGNVKDSGAVTISN